MTAHGILTRPFRRQTAKDCAYLLLGLPIGIVSFVVFVTGVATGLGMLVTLVGLPILAATAYAIRGISWVERRRAALVLGQPVAEVYRRAERPGVVAWAKALTTDPQTWKDAVWAIVLFVVGLAGFLVAVILWPVTLWALTLPFYGWATDTIELGDGSAEAFVTDHKLAISLLAGLVGIVLVFVTTWVCAGVAYGEAKLAELLLGPGADERRVGELTQSRAAAVEAQTSELRRIERDLHDGAQARLVAATIDMGLAREKLDSDPDEARVLLETAQVETREAISELRRLVSGIAPAVLADRGLDAALSGLVASCRVPVALDVELSAPLPESVEVAAYFVASEALTNVQKHADATQASLRVRVEGGKLVVEVGDNGRGGADGARRHGSDRARRARDGARRDAVRLEPGRRAHCRPRGDPVRVVIAEDLALLREGLVRLLEEGGHEVVASVSNGSDLLRVIVTEKPDVAVVDVRLPPDFKDEGIRAAIEARRRKPGFPVLVLSQYVEQAYAAELLADGDGAVGYLLKERVGDIGEFLDAVERVAAGGTAMDPEVVRQLVARRGPLGELSPREREVLSLMAEGRSNAGIAEALVVTESAVEKHVRQIFVKLRLAPTEGDHRRVLAVLAYLRTSS